MATIKQRQASTRNWLKARLLGFPYPHRAPITENERYQFDRIAGIISELLANWDDCTEELGFKKGPRCDRCETTREIRKYTVMKGTDNEYSTHFCKFCADGLKLS